VVTQREPYCQWVRRWNNFHLKSGQWTSDSGRVEVGPINTKQIGVWSLACSLSGERIAPGGWNKTICIWNTKTGELVGPIQNLGKHYMTSVVWSSDSTKIYSASDRLRPCSIAQCANYSIHSSTTILCIQSHFLPKTMSWGAWASKVLHSYGTQSPISHSASHSTRITTNGFSACRSLETGDT